MSDGDLPVVDPGDVTPSGHARVGGVLLAAGEGTRFEGGNKLLAEYDGEPVVWHAALSMVQAGLEPRLAVTGADAEAVEAAIDGLGLDVVHNPDFAAGQSTSVGVGVGSIGAVDAAVVVLGDMPAVEPGSIAALVRIYRAGEYTALAAACEGQRGNPVLFDRQYFDALRDVDGDVGGRDILLEGDESALVETGDPGVCRDVDTRADLAALSEP